MSNLKVNQSILLSPINASRGIIICDIDEEEPKTLLEIGGVITNSNHSPPYATITPIPSRQSSATPTTVTWTTEPLVHEIVPPPYSPYPDANEHKIIPIANVVVPPPTTWSSTNAQEKALQNAERGMFELCYFYLCCEYLRASLFSTINW